MEGSGVMIAAAKKLTGCRHMVKDLIEVFKEQKINLRGSQVFKFF
jgi:hypothetical protein